MDSKTSSEQVISPKKGSKERIAEDKVFGIFFFFLKKTLFILRRRAVRKRRKHSVLEKMEKENLSNLGDV